jgi:hypothetical protein
MSVELSFSACTMSSVRVISYAEQVVNIPDLLAHIASFMCYNAAPRCVPTACDHAWRLALLPSRTMHITNRRRIQLNPTKYAAAHMVIYLCIRYDHIIKQLSKERKLADGTPAYLTTNEEPFVLSHDTPTVIHEMADWVTAGRGRPVPHLR